MKKILLVLFLMINGIFASDFWETSWEQGFSTYRLTNKNKDTLEIICRMDRNVISLVDSKSNFVLDDEIVAIINDEVKLRTTTSIIDYSGPITGDQSWNRFIAEIGDSKSIVVETKNGETYSFNPKNSKKALEDINQTCSEYMEN